MRVLGVFMRVFVCHVQIQSAVPEAALWRGRGRGSRGCDTARLLCVMVLCSTTGQELRDWS